MRKLLFAGLALLPALAVAEPVPLTTLEQVQKLCGELQPAPHAASPLDQARADTDAKGRRDAALKQEWRVTLPAGQYRIAEADPGSGTLSVDTERAFRLFKGQAVLYPVDEQDLDLAVPEGQPLPASCNDLALELVVRPGQDSDPACTVGLAKDYVVGVEILSARLVNKAGATVAALEEDPSLERAAKAGGAPAVEIEPAVVEGSPSMAKQVTESLQAARPQLMACYQQGLSRQPALDGSLVLGFDVSSGKPGPITVVADSVQDDAVAHCVSQTVSGMSLKGAAPPAKKPAAKGAASEPAGRASVALRFERK